MAYIEIHPKSTASQEVIMGKKDELFKAVGEAVLLTFDIPEYDMIIEIHECSVIAVDSRAVKAESLPDAVLKLNTSDIQFHNLAETLKDRIVDAWNRVMGKEVTMECWIDFFHTWGCNIDFD